MDGGEGAVVVHDVKQLAFVLGILRGEREQVLVQRVEVLVLAAQVVELINGGGGEIDSEHFVTAHSPGLGIVAESGTGNQHGALGGAGGVLEKLE